MRVLLIAECPFTMPYADLTPFRLTNYRLARELTTAQRGRRPLTWGADQGLRLVDSRGVASHNATMQQTSSQATPRCHLSLHGSKSFTWAETSRHRDKRLKYQ